MIKWLQYLLAGALTLRPHRNYPPLDQQVKAAPGSSKFLSSHTLQRLDGLRERYDVPGFGIGIITSPEHAGDDWKSEVLSFGHCDHQYQPYREEVSFIIPCADGQLA